MRLPQPHAMVLCVVLATTGCQTRLSPRWVGAQLGMSAAAAGDIDADGIDDFVIGVPGRGRVDVFFGATGGPPTGGPEQSLYGLADRNGGFGIRVAAGRDYDEDGNDDLLVVEQIPGMPGRVYFYFGVFGQAYDPTPGAVFEGTRSFGDAVALCPSLYGDDPADIVIGDPDAGSVYIYKGRHGDPPPTPDEVYVGDAEGGAFGAVLACGESVNGSDNIADLVVGDPRFGNDAGKVYLIPGGTAGPDPVSWTYEGTDFTHTPSQLAIVNVNGDGVQDVLLSVDDFDGNVTNQGLLEVFYGGVGLATTADDYAFGPETGGGGMRFGASIADVGDLSPADGYDDLLIGAPAFGGGKGAVFRLPAGSLLPNGTPDYVGAPTTRFGTVAIGVGNVDDDNNGNPDVLITAPSLDGTAVLYYGTNNGLPTEPSWTVTTQ